MTNEVSQPPWEEEIVTRHKLYKSAKCIETENCNLVTINLWECIENSQDACTAEYFIEITHGLNKNYLGPMYSPTVRDLMGCFKNLATKYLFQR